MREIFPYQVITCSWHSFLSLLSLWSFLSSRSSLSNRSLLTLDKKRKLIKKRLYVVIKQLWEINVFHGYLSSCVERKNFRCPPLCWIMFKPYQVLTAVPDPITSISSYVKNSGDQYKWGKQKNENSDKSHVLNNYIFYMILPLFRLCKWCHVTPSFPKKCIIYSNFQSFKLVVKLTWHKGNFLVFNIYCNHHVTRFSFFASLNSHKRPVSRPDYFGGVTIKFTWFPPKAL